MTLVRQALKEHKGSKHPVAVLVRARSHLGNLTRRLTQEGISCRAVDLVPLALRPVVADLVQLLRALSHPADRLAWLSVLRAPFCGLTLTSLQRLFGEDHVTPVPVLLERCANRIRSQPPRRRPYRARCSTRRPLCGRTRAGPDHARATCWARTSTNACARPPPSCWTRATIPAPCPSRPGSRPVGDASAVRRCTRAVRRQ